MSLLIETPAAATTSVKLTCPEDVSGLERIMLAARGDLQRLLSTFLQSPIVIKLIYATTAPYTAPASAETPITQTRQVHLTCQQRTVCVATSTIVLTDAHAAALVLDEGYAIGQLFRTLGRTPKFALIRIETGIVDGRRELRRVYSLETEGVACEILEVFLDREMFVHGAAWLRNGDNAAVGEGKSQF